MALNAEQVASIQNLSPDKQKKVLSLLASDPEQAVRPAGFVRGFLGETPREEGRLRLPERVGKGARAGILALPEIFAGQVPTPEGQAAATQESELNLFREKEEIKSEFDKVNTLDSSGLTPEQELSGMALARRMFKRKWAEVLPTIQTMQRQGRSIDDIEDTVRFSRQSDEFSGVMRDAAQSALIGQTAEKTQQTLDFIDDAVQIGDTKKAKDLLRRTVLKQAPTKQQDNVVGTERTLKFLDEIEGDLNELIQNGIDTNIFTGTASEAANKIGLIVDPALQKIATKINVAIQRYRQSISGAAFTTQETVEYRSIFPSIGRIASFNKANIDALREFFQGDLDNFYGLGMGEANYQAIFKTNTGQQFDDEFEKMQNILRGSNASN